MGTSLTLSKLKASLCLPNLKQFWPSPQQLPKEKKNKEFEPSFSYIASLGYVRLSPLIKKSKARTTKTYLSPRVHSFKKRPLPAYDQEFCESLGCKGQQVPSLTQPGR